MAKRRTSSRSALMRFSISASMGGQLPIDLAQTLAIVPLQHCEGEGPGPVSGGGGILDERGAGELQLSEFSQIYIQVRAAFANVA